jgi:glycosyltransferase involved in cell wall biosynthesis
MASDQQSDLIILLPSRGLGGAEHYAVTVATHCSLQGWSVSLVAPDPRTLNPIKARLDAAGVTLSQLPRAVRPNRGGRAQALSDGVELAISFAYLRWARPRAAMLVLPRQDITLGTQLAAAAAGIPLTVVFQLAGRVMVQPRLKQRLYAWARSRATWIAVSQQNARALAEGFGCSASEITVVYNGAHFDSRSKDQRSSPRPDGPVLLCVGRLAYQKGLDLLVQALPFVRREFPTVRCLWAGEGELESELRTMIESYGLKEQVTFLGKRTDIPRLLDECDLFVFPSREEGHPFALLEAMGSGAAVVASDAAGIPEIITSEVHGLLHRAGDACDLMDKILIALRDPASMQMMAKGAATRAGAFTEAKMLDETFSILQRGLQAEDVHAP